MQRYNTKWGYIFISPWILGFLLFTLIPILATIAFSFTNYNPSFNRRHRVRRRAKLRAHA